MYMYIFFFSYGFYDVCIIFLFCRICYGHTIRLGPKTHRVDQWLQLLAHYYIIVYWFDNLIIGVYYTIYIFYIYNYSLSLNYIY